MYDEPQPKEENMDQEEFISAEGLYLPYVEHIIRGLVNFEKRDPEAQQELITAAAVSMTKMVGIIRSARKVLR